MVSRLLTGTAFGMREYPGVGLRVTPSVGAWANHLKGGQTGAAIARHLSAK